MHLKRHPEEHADYIEVKDSDTFMRFGQQQMSQPGPRALLNNRVFINLLPEEILQRKQEVSEVRKLSGIKSKYEYICLPDGKVSLGKTDASNSLI